MNISGIRPSTDFYNYYSSISGGYNNSIVDDSTLVVDEQIAKAGNDNRRGESIDNNSSNISQEDVRSKQTYTSYDYANEYDGMRTYSMKGSESELKNLDVVRAISDMQKDEAISQYQYFVGDRNRGLAGVGLEDFSL